MRVARPSQSSALTDSAAGPSPPPPAPQRAASEPLLQPRLADPGPEYHGMTANSSIMMDRLGPLGLFDGEPDTALFQIRAVTQDRVDRGCRALAFLKDREMVDSAVKRYFEFYGSTGVACIEPVMQTWLDQLWLAHGQALKQHDPRKMQELSTLVWENTQRSLTFDRNTKPMEWIRQSSGENIRWSVIGLIAAMVGLCAEKVGTIDVSFHKDNPCVPSHPLRMREVALGCAEFCRDCETLDEPYIWLLMESQPLTVAIHGRTSFVCWREGSEINNAMIAMGLHQGTRGGGQHDMPFFVAECRRRIASIGYACDLGLSVLLGRPPRLSYRYFATDDGPSDISDADMLLEGPDLDAALAAIDSTGYNKAGRIDLSTWMRTWLALAPRREDIQDLALGHYTPEHVLRRATDIRADVHAFWRSLPPFIRSVHESYDNILRSTPLETFFAYSLRQNALANDLLLELVCIRKTCGPASSSPDRLVRTALLILQDLLRFSQRRDMLVAYEMDIDNFMSIHGIRCAAIIASELLRQEGLPVYPADPLLPRSQTIQDLTVFATKLSEVRPNSCAYANCLQGHKVISRILDRILQPPPPLAAAAPAGLRQAGPEQASKQEEMEAVMVDGMSVPVDETAAAATAAMDTPMWGWDQGQEAPFLANDRDFMQWLENASFEPE